MQTRDALEFGRISPVLTALPLGLFGTVLLFDFGVLVSSSGFFASVSYWVLTAALLVGLFPVTGLLVGLTTGPLGPAARRVSGVLTGASAGMLVAFAMVWWVRTDRSAGVSTGLFLLELLAFALGIAGASYAHVISQAPVLAPGSTRGPRLTVDLARPDPGPTLAPFLSVRH